MYEILKKVLSLQTEKKEYKQIDIRYNEGRYSSKRLQISRV